MTIRDAIQALFVACCALTLPACQIEGLDDVLGGDGGLPGVVEGEAPEGEEGELCRPAAGEDGGEEDDPEEDGDEREDGEGGEGEEWDDEDEAGWDEDAEGEDLDEDERPVAGPSTAGAILTIGDSIFDWNVGDGSIAEAISRSLEREVVDAAVGGAVFLRGLDGDHIPSQYFAADWSWLVFDGGGNDLMNEGCAGAEADRLLERLVSDDGRDGEMADFARTRAAEGMNVLIMGYYHVRPGAVPEACTPALTELGRRQQRIADALDGVYFFDPNTVIDPRDAGNYNADGLHPSVQGSTRIGEGIAGAISEVEGR